MEGVALIDLSFAVHVSWLKWNSWIRADPIALSSADKYNLNGLCFCGRINTGRDIRYCLISSNAFCCASPHTNFWSAFNFNRGLNDCILPDRLAINLQTIIDWSSIFVSGATTLLMAVIVFWLISIPLSWTVNPRNYPVDTPNAPLLGFIFNPCFLVHSKALRKSAKCSWCPLDFTTTSSI